MNMTAVQSSGAFMCMIQLLLLLHNVYVIHLMTFGLCAAPAV